MADPITTPEQMRRWTYYIPDDGETKEDARSYYARATDGWEAEDAARYAAEDDWDCCDGWERGTGTTITIVVVSPEGREYRFRSTSETTITHSVTGAIDEGASND